MDTFKQIQDMAAEYQRTVKEKGEELLKQHFKAMFAEYPGLQAVRWTQCTPYFNDGDTCEFSVHEWTFKTGDSDEGDEEDGFVYRYGSKTKKLDEIADRYETIPEDVLETVFGDHVQITATRDGFEVTEYSHD